MSAFQLPAEHLGAIVRFYLTDCPDHLRGQYRNQRPNRVDAAAMLASLAVECHASVRYRYPSGPLPGPITFEDGPVVCDDRLRLYQKLTPVQVIKACDCYCYQSCEHPGWDQSEAKHLIECIREAAIALLPGYEAAAWEICDGATEVQS